MSKVFTAEYGDFLADDVKKYIYEKTKIKQDFTVVITIYDYKGDQIT